MVDMDSMDVAESALRALRGRAPRYLLYGQYYDGDHRLAFATDKFRNALGSLFKTLADNLCPAVVDAVADRLRVVGFGVEEGPENAADSAWTIWQGNRMDRRSGEVHVEALRSGDAYVIVWPDAGGQPRLYPQAGASMTVHYDEDLPGTIDYAAKLWRMDDGRMRLNLYFPDRIEKYASRNKLDTIPDKARVFEPYEVPGEPWPLPNPWGTVPVFHFANNAGVGHHGRSELGDVVPVQDALNKALADMLVAMEYVALPQRWATGLEVDIDEATGKPKVPFTPGVERVWAVGDAEVRFGQFDPANLEQFLAVQDSFRAEIARVSGTPLHYLMLGGGEFPSGEAMRTAEARFLAKVEDRQLAFGNGWEDVLGLALAMAGEPVAQLSTLWRDATPRSAKEVAEVALIKEQLGVSREQILKELGYSPEEIDRMAVEREATSAQLGEQMLSAFEKGE